MIGSILAAFIATYADTQFKTVRESAITPIINGVEPVESIILKPRQISPIKSNRLKKNMK